MGDGPTSIGGVMGSFGQVASTSDVVPPFHCTREKVGAGQATMGR